MLETIRNPLRSPDHVYWCSDLCRENPAFKLAIEDLPPATIRQIVEKTDSRADFEDAVLDAWT